MAGLIDRVLTAERHVVETAPDGVAAVALALGSGHDVIVLDRTLPDIDGVTLLGLLRARGISTPVLMLTALGSVEDRVAGLEAGADDYLAKPFALQELLARVRALLRRTAAAEQGNRDVARVGQLALDRRSRQVTWADRVPPGPNSYRPPRSGHTQLNRRHGRD